jgi:hypothetical protein
VLGGAWVSRPGATARVTVLQGSVRAPGSLFCWGVLSWRLRVSSSLRRHADCGVEIRVRVEIMGSGKFRNVGKYQWVLIMINPIISTRM